MLPKVVIFQWKNHHFLVNNHRRIIISYGRIFVLNMKLTRRRMGVTNRLNEPQRCGAKATEAHGAVVVDINSEFQAGAGDVLCRSDHPRD